MCLAVLITVVAAKLHGPSASNAAALSASAANLPTDAQMAATFGPLGPLTHLSALPAGTAMKISREQAIMIAATNGPAGSSAGLAPSQVVAATYSVDSSAPALALSGGAPVGSRPVWVVQYRNVEQPVFGGHAVGSNGATNTSAEPETFVGKFTAIIDANTGEWLVGIGSKQ
jgi:hypothetical protein